MIDNKIRKYVDNRHKSQISAPTTAYKYYKTNVRVKSGERRSVTAPSLNDLYRKLFDIYSAQDKKKEPTLADAFEWLLDHKKNVEGCQQSTINENRRRWNNFTSPELLATPLAKITEDQVCRTIRIRCADYAQLHGKPIGLQGIRLYLQMMSAIYIRIAPSRGITALNPVINVKAEYFSNCANGGRAKAEDKCMEPSDVAKLVQYCKDHPSTSAYGVRLASTLGLRVGELCQIKWSDIEGDYIHIHVQTVREEDENGHTVGWTELGSTKNERRRSDGGRYVPLLPDTRVVLGEIKAQQVRLGIYSNDGYILSLDPQKPNKPLLHDSYIEFFRRTCKRLGIPVTHNHSLRMYVNSYIYIPAGLTAPERAYFLGHSTQTNERYYSWAGKEARGEAIEKILKFTQIYSA